MVFCGTAGVIVLFTRTASDNHALADAHAVVLELLGMGNRRMGTVDINRFGRLQERDGLLQVCVIQQAFGFFDCGFLQGRNVGCDRLHFVAALDREVGIQFLGCREVRLLFRQVLQFEVIEAFVTEFLADPDNGGVRREGVLGHL